MCIVAAVTDEYPWGRAVSDVQVRQFVKSGAAINRSEGFTDEQWELVELMTQPDPAQRLPLDLVVERMTEFARHESNVQLTPIEAEAVAADRKTTATSDFDSVLSAESTYMGSRTDSMSDDRFAPSY